MTNTDQLDVDIIEDGLSSVIAPSKVLVYRSTSSTNNIAWEYANNPANNGLAVFAEEQTRGRGRMGNKWLSAPGQSILCSILLLDFDCPCELMATVSATPATPTSTAMACSTVRITARLRPMPTSPISTVTAESVEPSPSYA